MYWIWNCGNIDSDRLIVSVDTKMSFFNQDDFNNAVVKANLQIK